MKPAPFSAVLLVTAVAGIVLGRYTARMGDGPDDVVRGPRHDARQVAGSAGAKPARTAERGDSTPAPDERWGQWASRTRSAAVERELVAALEEMARTAPARAMELAAKESNLRSRELLRQAALRGWAATAPDAALAAAMNLPGVDNRAAIAAVLQGASADPATVVQLARRITDGSDPVAIDYGNLAIAALAQGGHFAEALRFAVDASPMNRALWVNEAFSAWAASDPQQALAELQRVTDPELRREARAGLIAGWAQADPGSLAEQALHEAAPEDRAQELGQGLTNWVLRDPAAASRWLSQRDPDPNLDPGLLTVATLPALMTQRPEVATEWAGSISDPVQRRAALRTIGEEWRRRAPTALAQYLAGASHLSRSDRDALAGVAEDRTSGP